MILNNAHPTAPSLFIAHAQIVLSLGWSRGGADRGSEESIAVFANRGISRW